MNELNPQMRSVNPNKTSKCLTKKKCKLTSGINIGYINVRSVLPKVEQVQHFLTDHNIHILGVGETWLDNTVTDHEINIDGYTSIRNDRNRHGGGVMFYIKNNLSYEHAPFNTNEVEQIWIKLQISKQTYLLGNVYRPPQSNNDYLDQIMDTVEQVFNITNNVILIGDLNIDYKFDLSLASNPIHNMETLFQMKQLVEAPTRVTTSTATLIDVILTSVPDIHTSTKVLPIAMSDHFPVITCVHSKQDVSADHKVVRFRDYKNFKVNDFLADLRTSLEKQQHLFDNTDIQQTSNVEQLWQQFKQTFLEVSDLHAPIKTMRMKTRYCPWINNNIIEMMYKRDRLHGLACKNKCPNAWSEYTKCRNSVTSMIKSEKRKYFDFELCKNANNPKQFWKKINMLTGQKNKNNAANDISAQDFNDFFANIGHSVINQNANANANSDSLKWRNPPCIHSFKFSECSVDDVSKFIKQLGSDTSNDILNFDAKLLYLSSDIICPFIVKILNTSLFNGKLPNEWKFSRVTPIYKGKGNKTDKNNYRPISVISHIGKVIEKVVQKQFMHYLLSNELIAIDQSAYRPMYNTQTAIHRIIDTWIDNISDGLLTGVCLLDISKCFDTIDHNLLRIKLGYYGVKDIELNWFSDYLNNRSQVVCHKNVLSNANDITIGVPQGSVLGPILFMLFINDIGQNSGTGVCNLYADDVIAYCQGTTLTEVNDKLQDCVSQLSSWYQNNKLSVNTTKSEIMLVTSNRRVISDQLNIMINGENLKYVECANYLGMKIDCHLSWNDYIDKLCSSVASKLHVLRRLKGTVSQNVMSKIYCSMIQPCIDYGISVWGQTNEYNLLRIQRLQNYAARLITNNFDYINSRGVNIVKNLKWMTVKQRCMYFTAILMFKCIHGLAPSYLVNDIIMNCDVNGINTRSHPMNVYVPYASSQFAKRSFKYSGAVIWNDLPAFLKEMYNLNGFKRKLKDFILL